MSFEQNCNIYLSAFPWQFVSIATDHIEDSSQSDMLWLLRKDDDFSDEAKLHVFEMNRLQSKSNAPWGRASTRSRLSPSCWWLADPADSCAPWGDESAKYGLSRIQWQTPIENSSQRGKVTDALEGRTVHILAFIIHEGSPLLQHCYMKQAVWQFTRGATQLLLPSGKESRN